MLETKGTPPPPQVCHLFEISLITSLTGEKIFPLAWEVTESLEMYDIPVVSLTSDGAKPNRRFYSMCQQQQQKGQPKDVPYKTFNPFREGEDLFFFCDAPHLLKTARNCFSNSFAHSKSRKMQVISLSLSLCLSCASINALDVSHCRRMGRQLVGSGLRVFTSEKPQLLLLAHECATS